MGNLNSMADDQSWKLWFNEEYETCLYQLTRKDFFATRANGNLYMCIFGIYNLEYIYIGVYNFAHYL